MDRSLIITLLTQGRDDLVRTAQAMPQDKLAWRPLDNGRSVLDLLGDAAQRPRLVLGMIDPDSGFVLSPDTTAQLRQERAGWTREECLQTLDAGIDALLAYLNALSDEELSRPLTLPVRGAITLPIAGWFVVVYRTFVARFAQINYVQILYGDFEMH